MTSIPNDRNGGSPSHRGRRLRADEVRQARQSRAAPLSGRNVQAPRYQPRLSEEFPAVQQGKRKKRWTPLRLGLLATGLSLLLLAAIIVVPILIQMHRTAERVFDQQDERITIADNPEGTPVIVTPERSDDDDDGFDDFVDESEDLPDWDGNERVNIALFGVDSREGDEDESARSDTIIIVSIDPETKTAGMMSIPRDLQVDIPNLGTEKINAAYAQGGRELARAVVEYHFDINVHYYAEVDFVGFINIVDTIGGVVIDNPATIKDDDYEWTRVYFPTGVQHMDGETALRYVRTRYDDNDFARGQRQQQVLRALRQQGIRLNLITQARSLLQDVEENFRTDLSMRQSLGLARLANDIEGEDIESYSMIDCTTEDYVPDLYYYLIPDWDCIHGVVETMIPVEEREPEEASVDHSARVLIENGTFVDGLAGRTRNFLNNAGYADVDIRQADDAGNIPESSVVAYGEFEGTGRDVAEQIGLDPDTVIVEDGEHPDGYDIIVILGDDSPDPDTG